MDPLSQGVLGALAAQAVVKSTSNPTQTSTPHQSVLAKAAILGALAGMAPDLDVLIQSDVDSLLSLEYHRQFTHSLLFIPVGGLICAVLFYLLLGQRWQLSFKRIYLFSVLGYATHGLLDSCTSYGTQLFWPFTDYRVSWDIISIIDPLFTLPLLLLVVLASRLKKLSYVYWALAWMSMYFSLGVLQHQRAIAAGNALIAERGQEVIRLEAKPSFANLLVWKVVYETDQHFFVDAVRLGFAGAKIIPGDHVSKLEIARDLPWLNMSSQQAKDIERFRWFSAGFISKDPNNPYQVVDMRYSSLPNQVKPLWGIRLSPVADEQQHVEFYSEPRKDRPLAALWRMIVE